MHDDVLSMARDMRGIYSVDVMHELLSKKAAATDASVCWEQSDLELYFTATSPEAFLHNRCDLVPPDVPQDVRAAAGTFLLGGGGYSLFGGSTAAFETRNGQLRIAPDARSTVPPWLAELGECADPRCGCFRPEHPTVRQRFRETLLARVRAPTAQRPLRYLTVGAGGLLYDYELLLALRQKFGVRCIELVVAVDRKYAFDGKAVLRLQSLLGPETPEVHAFYHLEGLHAQLHAHPATFGQCDVYVQCDCDDVDDAAALAVARAALAPDGVALVLRGDGTIVCLVDPGPRDYSTGAWATARGAGAKQRALGESAASALGNANGSAGAGDWCQVQPCSVM